MNNYFSVGDSVIFTWYADNSKETVEGFIVSKMKAKNPGCRCVIKNNMVTIINDDSINNINKTFTLFTIQSLNGDTYTNLKTDCLQPASILLLEF